MRLLLGLRDLQELLPGVRRLWRVPVLRVSAYVLWCLIVDDGWKLTLSHRSTGSGFAKKHD